MLDTVSLAPSFFSLPHSNKSLLSLLFIIPILNKMDRFKVQEELGDGTFGTVFRAIRREDNSEVRSPSRTNLPSILSKPMLPLLLSA